MDHYILRNISFDPIHSERVILIRDGSFGGRNSGAQRRLANSPRVVCVGADLPAVFVVNAYDIAENVFVKEVIVEIAFIIHARAVFDTGGRTVFVVDKVEEILYVILRPCLG